MRKQLPIYEMLISEDTDQSSGVFSISFVESPATELTFIKFNQDKEQINFSVQDSERRIVSGAILVPNKMIYRNQKDEMGKIIFEYETFITKDTIEKTVHKFFKNNRSQNVDTEHSGLLLNGITMFESFIIDSTRGQFTPSTYPTTLPDGTWFGSYKVESDEIWKQILDNTFNGFSISGLFDMAQVNLSFVKHNEKVLNELNNLFKDL